MKHSVSILILVLLEVSSSSHATAGPPSKGASPAVTSICEINRDPVAYMGKVVTVSGIYKTDSMVYEYIEGQNCKRRNILPIGFRVPQRDASVTAFYMATALYCAKHNQPVVCVLEGPISVRGKIVHTIGAHLQPNAVVYAINLYSVSYDWLQAKR